MISQPGKAPKLPSPGNVKTAQHRYPQCTKRNDDVNRNNNGSTEINRFQDNNHYDAPNMNRYDNKGHNVNHNNLVHAWKDDNSSTISDHNQVNFRNYLKYEQEMRNKVKYDQYQRRINHRQNHQNSNFSSDNNQSYQSYHLYHSYRSPSNHTKSNQSQHSFQNAHETKQNPVSPNNHYLRMYEKWIIISTH